MDMVKCVEKKWVKMPKLILWILMVLAFANIDHTKNKLNYKPKISIEAYRSLLNGINLHKIR